MLKVRGKLLHVDVLEEIQQFEWNRGEIRGSKWLSCSPFRLEKKPSFAVHLESGLYIDSALEDDYWRKGPFQKLLSFLLGCTVEEAEDFLLEKYSPFYKNINELELKLKLSLPQRKINIPLDNGIFERFNFTNNYLINERGIKKEILDEFKVGFDPRNNCSVFIWFDKAGQPVNAKFRKNSSKKFFYLKDASPISNHIYLLNTLYGKRYKTGYITESEIDSLYIRSLGEDFPAVALGGSNLSEQQKRLLLSAPVDSWVICTDNDKAGKRIEKEIQNKLNGYKRIEKINLPEGIKDVNELPLDALKEILKNRVTVGLSFMV